MVVERRPLLVLERSVAGKTIQAVRILARADCTSRARIGARREKATVFSGSQTHPATVIPAGSNWSGDGGNEVGKAFDGKDRFSGSASPQAVT